MLEVSCKHDRRRHPIVLLFNDGVLISEITKEGKVIQNVALLAISKKMVVICFDLLSQYSPEGTWSSTKKFGQATQ